MFKTIARSLIASALLSHCAVFASDDFVFGIKMGDSPQIPECSKNKSPGLQDYYEVIPSKTCFEHKNKYSIGNYNVSEIAIKYTDDDKPSMAPVGELNAILIDDKIESIQFYTGGAATRDSDLRELTKKYGKPTKTKWLNEKTAFGVNIKIVVAMWHTKNLFVYLQSYDDRADVGTIRIETEKGCGLRLYEEKEKTKSAKKL
jgi:hypothetical protein